MEIYLCFSDVFSPVSGDIFNTCPSAKVRSFDPEKMQETEQVIDSLHRCLPDSVHSLHLAGAARVSQLIAALKVDPAMMNFHEFLSFQLHEPSQ